MQYDMELQRRLGTKHIFDQESSRSHGNRTPGATVDDSFPGNNTTKEIYRGPQGPVLDGTPLGQLDIEGINNNYALPFTLAEVASRPSLTPDDTSLDGYRSHAYS